MAFIFDEKAGPMRETLEDGTVVTRACAWSPPGCHAVGCGVKLFVKDGELVKVEGDPEHPLTRGRLCVRCLALREFIYHPDRLLHPMKRKKEDRGLDRWERISWDEATALIVEKTNQIKEAYGPESIIVYSGTGRESVRYAFSFQSQVLGTPNHCYAQSGWSCMGPRQTAMTMLFGSAYLEYDYGGSLPGMWDNPDFELPKYVLMLGKEPLKSNPDGLWGHSLIELMKKGTELILVDPRTPWIGTHASHHLQLLPNTDTALIMALINVVIEEGLYDHDFVDRWCYGFDELAERARDYPPSFAAEACGLEEEEIRKIARLLGTEKPWGMLIGVATDQNPNGCQLVQAICSLAAITGNLDIPGGTILGTHMQFDMNAASPLPEELQQKTIGWKEYPILPVLLNTTHPDITLEALETDKPYPVKMAWIDSTNLLSPTCSAQPKRWKDALKRMDFVVAKDVFMTPTIMALADVVLPVASWAEHDGIVMTNQGCQMGIIGAINKAFSVGECMSDLEMYIHFGKAFHGADWKGAQSVHEYLENDMKSQGLTWEEMSEHVVGINTIGGYKKYERGLIRPDGKPGFTTPTGRVELYSTRYQQLGDDPLPYYLPPQLGKEAMPEYAAAYPFLLVTGPRHYASFHSEHRQIPSLRRLNPDPICEMHPEVAEEKGIRDGDRVLLENPWGSAEFRAVITPCIRKDVLSCDHGWWFPEEDGEEPNLFGVWKSNVNEMEPHKVIGKMGFGAPYKAMCANIRRING